MLRLFANHISTEPSETPYYPNKTNNDEAIIPLYGEAILYSITRNNELAFNIPSKHPVHHIYNDYYVRNEGQGDAEVFDDTLDWELVADGTHSAPNQFIGPTRRATYPQHNLAVLAPTVKIQSNFALITTSNPLEIAIL